MDVSVVHLGAFELDRRSALRFVHGFSSAGAEREREEGGPDSPFDLYYPETPRSLCVCVLSERPEKTMIEAPAHLRGKEKVHIHFGRHHNGESRRKFSKVPRTPFRLFIAFSSSSLFLLCFLLEKIRDDLAANKLRSLRRVATKMFQ